jgi:hypothetical protein
LTGSFGFEGESFAIMGQKQVQLATVIKMTTESAMREKTPYKDDRLGEKRS